MDHAKEIERMDVGAPAGKMSADATRAACGSDCEMCPKRLVCPFLAELKGGRA